MLDEKPTGINPEGESQEPTIADIVAVCVEVLGDEVAEDFTEDMEFDDALGYAYTLLIENGEDPDELFRSKGIIE